MGAGYGLYRRWLRPGWKRSRFNTRARCELQQQSSSTKFYDVTSGRTNKGGAGEPQDEPQDEHTSPAPITLSDPYPINDAIDEEPDDERRPLSPFPGRCRVGSSPNRKMQSGRKEEPEF